MMKNVDYEIHVEFDDYTQRNEYVVQGWVGGSCFGIIGSSFDIEEAHRIGKAFDLKEDDARINGGVR